MPGIKSFVREASKILAVLLCAINSSCASISYVDKDGARHVIGFVHVSTPAAQAAGLECNAGNYLQVQALGVTILSTPESSGLTLGYAREEFGVLHLERETEGEQP